MVAIVEFEGWLLSDGDDGAGGVSVSALVSGSLVKWTAYSDARPSCPPPFGDAGAASSAARSLSRTVTSIVPFRVEVLLPRAVSFDFGAGIVFTELERDRVDVEADARGAV